MLQKKQKDIRDKRIKQVDMESDFSSSDGEISEKGTSFGVKVHQVKRKPPKTEILINGQKCNLLVDTGSSIKLPNETFVNKMKPTPKISKMDTKAYAYGQRKKLPIKGKFTASVETSNKIITSTFYIISGDYDSLLSYETSVQLELVPEINSVTAKLV